MEGQVKKGGQMKSRMNNQTKTIKKVNKIRMRMSNNKMRLKNNRKTSMMKIILRKFDFYQHKFICCYTDGNIFYSHSILVASTNFY